MKTGGVLKILFAASGAAVIIWFVSSKQGSGELSVTPEATVTVGDATFRVELAEAYDKQTAGLSGRAPLKENEGMLFIFPVSVPQTFWMKGMRFPLDFVWINADKVAGVTENAPPDGGLLTYGSPGPVDKVLEINAGEVARHAIKTGEEVRVTSLQ